MKIVNFFNKSISREVLGLVGSCFLFFIISSLVLFHFQKNFKDEYINQREKIENKQEITSTIYENMTAKFFIMENGLSFKVPENRETISNEASEVNKQKEELRKLLGAEDERLHYRVIESFIDYYYSIVIPKL